MAYKKARPGKKHPNFQEIYGLDDIVVTQWMWFSHEEAPTVLPGLSPIALFGCKEIDRESTNSFRYGTRKEYAADEVLFCTLRYLYALNVWKAALDEAKGSDDFSAVFPHWTNRDDSFRMLVHGEGYRPELVQKLWKRMQEIADSGSILVSEGFSEGDAKLERSRPDWPNPLHVALDARTAQEVRDKLDSKVDIKIAKVLGYPYQTTPKSFGWDEIKDLFGEVTLAQRELLMHDQMHRCEPIDKVLMKACDRLDMDAVKAAIEQGANVNALDEDGESAMTKAAESGEFWDEDAASQDCFNRAKEIILFLLGLGADIDLYGYDGDSPLTGAFWGCNEKMVQFLLELGADPNVNTLLTDSAVWGYSSLILERIYTREGAGDADEFEEAVGELVEKAGGRLIAWGWNPARQRITGRPFLSIWPFEGRVFVDNSYTKCGDARAVCIEREGQEPETITLDSVPELQVWFDEFLANCGGEHPVKRDQQWWLAWRERGEPIARKIRALLPDDVDFYYLFDSPDVVRFYGNRVSFEWGEGFKPITRQESPSR